MWKNVWLKLVIVKSVTLKKKKIVFNVNLDLNSRTMPVLRSVKMVIVRFVRERSVKCVRRVFL